MESGFVHFIIPQQLAILVNLHNSNNDNTCNNNSSNVIIVTVTICCHSISKRHLDGALVSSANDQYSGDALQGSNKERD